MPQESFSRRSILIAGMGLGASMVIGVRPLAACESEACEDATNFAPKTVRKKTKKKPTENCARLRREMKRLDNELGRVFKKRRKLYEKMQAAKAEIKRQSRELELSKDDRRQLMKLKRQGYSYFDPFSDIYKGSDASHGDPIAPEIRKDDRAIKRARTKMEKAQRDYDIALYDRRQLSKDVRRLKSLIRSKIHRLKRAGCYFDKPKYLYKAR